MSITRTEKMQADVEALAKQGGRPVGSPGSPRWAIISDIHSNLEALLAVLDDIREQKVPRILCLGDVVGYNANPSECVEVIRRLKAPVLLGNHDEMAATDRDLGKSDYNLQAVAGLKHSRNRLSPSQKEWLKTWPITFDAGDFVGVHASLAASRQWPYIHDERGAGFHFERQKHWLAFCGHTHEAQVFYKKTRGKHCDRMVRVPENVQFEPGYKYLINVGSVGQPRDRNPKACYGILDLNTKQFCFRRVPYDLREAQRKIVQAGLPPDLADRLEIAL